MWFVLEIFIVGLLFNSGFTIPAPASDEVDYPSDDTPPVPISEPKIVTQPLDIVPQIGNDYVLPCDVTNNESDEAITWTFNTSLLFADKLSIIDKYSKTLKLGNNSNLIINNFTPTFYGNYSCEIPQFNLSVVHHLMPREPVIVESLMGKKYVENLSELSLTCRTKGFPTPTISWSRKYSENSVETDLNSKSANYVIPRATFSDSGIYTCRAKNDQSSDWKSINITIISGVAPLSAKVHASEAESSTQLCCVFDENRKIMWKKNGKVIPLSDRFNISSEKHKNCLVIKKVKEEDLGTYTCQVEKHEMEQADIELNGSPPKPVVKMVGSDDSKNPVVTWSVASLIPISEYKVFHRKAEETEWTEVAKQTKTPEDQKDEIKYTFTNLKNGRYSVKLEVFNKYGSNESIENGALVVDQIDPSGVMAEKINSGAESHYRISSLCALFVILMRLWSC